MLIFSWLVANYNERSHCVCTFSSILRHMNLYIFLAKHWSPSPEIARMLVLQQLKDIFKETGSVKVKSAKVILTGRVLICTVALTAIFCLI